jgi:hypothetical protein
MIATWMLFGLAVGGVLVVVGLALEDAARMAKLPLRWGWAGVLLAILVLVAIAPLRRAEPVPAPGGAVDGPAQIVGSEALPAAFAGADPETRSWARSLAGIATANAALPAVGQALARANVDRLDRPLSILWAMLTGALLALIGWTLHRGRWLRARLARIELAGVPVRISEDVGPAVIGVLRPEVVLPRWILDSPAAARRLAVEHECEHVRARDPLLLLLGSLVAALVAWNPFAWWLLSRLRLAVELDCDARVLRREPPLAYGRLLLRVAGHPSAMLAAAPALGGRRSHLERRLRAMRTDIPRWPLVRGGALTMVAMGFALVACDLTLPTPVIDDPAALAPVQVSEPAGMHADLPMVMVADDGAVLARRLRFSPGDDMLYIVDGAVAGPERVSELVEAEAIAAIELLGGAAAVQLYGQRGASGVMRIVSRTAPEASELNRYLASGAERDLRYLAELVRSRLAEWSSAGHVVRPANLPSDPSGEGRLITVEGPVHILPFPPSSGNP